MQLYPAIDLQNHKCVRLFQGKFDQVTIYDEDPLTVAKAFESQGAKWLHVVDLDSAKQNGATNRPILKEICKNTSLSLQVGGGIRSENDIRDLLDSGVKRLIIGSLAVKNPQLIKSWLEQFSEETIVLAFDVFCHSNIDLEPNLAISGWQEKSSLTLWQLLEEYSQTQLKHVLCTDISRDGTLHEPNFILYQRFLNQFPQFELQASGGIANLEQLTQLKKIGISAAVIGKALYEKRFSLKQAIQQGTLC